VENESEDLLMLLMPNDDKCLIIGTYLRRPLAFIDIETTGINVSSDRIVEISILKINPNGKEEWLSLRLNPEMPIRKSQQPFTGSLMQMLLTLQLSGKLQKARRLS
jgi:DNA polymerase III epsilon subunit-like protein